MNRPVRFTYQQPHRAAVHQFAFRSARRLLLFIIAILGVILSGWLLIIMLSLYSASQAKVDAYFVLGGSISREIYVAQQVKKDSGIRVLISQGSQDPCIWLIFQRENASIEQVWLEKCAKSTFSNFYFGIPILRSWGVRKIKLITSASHLPRAQWLAQILGGAHGIWVETEIVPEQGIPANRESFLKTGLDVTRSLVWALLSHVIQPKCSQVTRLADVDIEQWRKQSFKCEYQGKVN